MVQQEKAAERPAEVPANTKVEEKQVGAITSLAGMQWHMMIAIALSRHTKMQLY